MKTLWLGAASAAALLCAAAPALAANAPDLSKAPRMGPWGFDMSGRDTSVAPSKDFFDYANGTYLNKLEIPADRSRYGAFDALQELSQSRMRAVAEKSAANTKATGDEAKLGAFYRSFMDEKAVDALGAKPLATYLAAIRAVKTHDEMAGLMGGTMRKFGGSFFGSYVHDDAKDPEKYTVYLVQGGLGLPDRDYYLEDRFKTQKAAYEAYIAQMLTLAGWERPAENAKAIVALETEIAKVSWTRAERRDDDKTYNPFEIAKLQTYAPGFAWQQYMDGAQLSKAGRVVVSENTAFPKIAAIYANTPIETLKAWSAFNLADQAAPYLSKEFDQANYEFRSKTLSGQPLQQPALVGIGHGNAQHEFVQRPRQLRTPEEALGVGNAHHQGCTPDITDRQHQWQQQPSARQAQHRGQCQHQAIEGELHAQRPVGAVDGKHAPGLQVVHHQRVHGDVDPAL